MNPYKYECYDNDNHIRVYFEDGQIDEVHFSMENKKEWIVIGYGDLEAALHNAHQIKKG